MLAAKGMDDLRLRQIAVAVFVLYRTVNHLRHTCPRGDATAEYKKHYMNQMLHEAARGDSRLQAALRRGQVPNRYTPSRRRRPIAE